VSGAATFRLSGWQLALLVFTLSLCVTPFAFPGVIDRQVGREGWTLALPATGVGLWGTLAAAALARRFPGRPLDRTAVDLLGRWPGLAYVGALALLMVGGAAGNLLVFAQVSTATQLTRLPGAWPAVLTGAVGALAAYRGPVVGARTAEVLAPLMAAGLLVVYLSPAGSVHLGRLLPLAAPPPDRLLRPDVLAAAGTIRGFLALLVLGPFCRPRPEPLRLCAACAGAGALVAASLGLPVALFGEAFTARLRYPFLTAVGTVAWQWLPVHHLVVLTMLVWHAVILVVFAAYLWMGAWLLHRLWPRLPWPAALVGLAAAEALAGAQSPPSPLVHGLLDVWNDAVVVLGVLVPTLLWLAARRRPPRRPPARA
jgi:hypothetical protein